MHNSLGNLFRITSFGESHGNLIGIIIDGCPAGLKVDYDMIQNELNRRRPGQSSVSTSRSEKDKFKILSGVLEGFSTGAPIAMIIENEDKDSSKYDQIKVKPRPSHADFPAMMRYGEFVDLRGSGRFSGRNTAGFVMAGALAKQLLNLKSIKIAAYTQTIKNTEDSAEYTIKDIVENGEKNEVRAINTEIAEKMKEEIQNAKNKKDSVGGIIKCIVEGIPAGIGNPIFDSLESKIASAIFSVPAVRGIEFGLGFEAVKKYGSEHNDVYAIKDGKVITKTNHCGGIIGGISNGMPIVFNVAIKPTASIGQEQNTIDLSEMKDSKLKIDGRHDPCIVPRAVPVIEAITAVILCDILIEFNIIKKILS